eukprot:11094452-Ditylum_brightwellii.AAC.1
MDFDAESCSTFDNFFILNVDGVHCHVFEPRYMPSAGWYLQKLNKSGLCYEIGVAIHHDKVCWVNGHFPAGQRLMSKIPHDKHGIGDEGCVGVPSKVSTRNELNSAKVKEFKSRVRARHETVNGKLKSFGILNQTFCTTGKQHLEKHKAAFEACLVLLQYKVDNGSKKPMK